MGTVATIGDRARLRVRDQSDGVYEDADILDFINWSLHFIHSALVDVESVYIYGHGTITLADGTIEYTPDFSHEGFLTNGVWLDGEDWYLKQVTESDKVYYDYDSTSAESEPEAFYLTEDGAVGFLPVPDQEYTVHVQYIKPLTEMTDYDDDDLPWSGIWNPVIERLVAYDMLDTQFRNGATQIVMADTLWKTTMNKVLRVGTRRRRQRSGMFEREGI